MRFDTIQDILNEKSIHGFLSQTPKRSYLWQVAMPKSGSTWLSNIFSSLYAQNGGVVGSLVPAYGTRNQEIDPRRFLTAGQVGSVDTDVFFVQQHCQFSQYTHSLITQSRTKVIFQYRKIDDAIVSLADHIRAAITDPSNPERTALTPSILALDPDRILDYVIDIEAPWYFKFLDGWMNTEFYQSGQLSPVRYEELKADPVDTVYRLVGDLGLNVRVGTVETAVEDSKNKMTRKNVGVNGRGKLMLNDSQKTKIDQMASFYNLPNDVL